MSFLILFLLLTFVFVLLLMGGSVLIQSWLYNVPADRIVVRALATGGAIAAFFTIWSVLDSSSPGKFDSIFEGADLQIKEYDKVISVRKTKTKEEELAFRKSASGAKVTYVREDDIQKTWSRSDADGMVIALLIKEEGATEPTRFEIPLVNGKLPTDSTYFEKGGRRYVEAPMLGKIVTPRSGSFFLRALMMVLHLVVLVVGLWLGMNFVFGHALGLGFALWLFMTLAFLPILFREMRTPPPGATPPAKVQVIEPIMMS